MFGRSKKLETKTHAVGAGLAAVLPVNEAPWYQQSHLLYLNFLCVSMALLTAANGYDGSMMNGLMTLPQWFTFMDNPRGAWLGFINSVQALSSTVAYPFVAYFANRWGRKKGLFVGYVFIVAGSMLQGFGPNSTSFILGRVLLGQPSAWWGGLGPLVVTELAYPTHRSFLTSSYNAGWYVGSLLAAWATFGTRNYASDWAWRIPSILQIAIPIVALPAVLLVPESPRYLISKGRSAEARAILTRFHAGGDEGSPLVEFEMNEIEVAIEHDSQISNGTSWMDLISTRGNRHRAFISVTLGAFAQFNGVSVVSYYLAAVLKTAGITSITQQTLINGCLQIWNLILAISAAATTDSVGRRPLFLISSAGMLVCFVSISGLSGGFASTGSSSIGLAVIPFLFLYYGFYDIAFTPLIVSYPAEIWPYHLRARGIALTQLSTYLSLFFNIFVNPIALDAIAWKYYLVFVGILVIVNITVYFFYPETAGHSLEEMAIVFDKVDAILGTNEKDMEAITVENIKNRHAV
ncbi:sugar transporter [Boeremia exigua]|uniref:sugar transporter n=1 Tax=Boeremia exigua TaxID=749465 RepID=UPI001E8CB6B8|nr:sugar transporter [Boeremia exigua]KAH6621712.1 sugar transporter [Boeremia exigua]